MPDSAPRECPGAARGGTGPGRVLRGLLQFLGALALVAIVASAAGWIGLEWWARRDLRGPGAAASLRVVLRPGLSMRGVAQQLEKARVVRSAPLMMALVALHGTDRRLRAGEYAFAPGTPPLEVMRALVKGPESLAVKVVLPEGWTVARMADRLARCGVIADRERFLRLCADAAFLNSVGIPASTADGFLFPDTYFFIPPTDEKEVIRRMAARFEKEIQSLGLRPGLNSANAYPLSYAETVVLASILEREAADPAETALISSVFHNRLKLNMPLGSCATVRFALNKWDAPLTMADLKVDSLYNTYAHQGLPPAAICNPGRNALEAAFRPAKSTFLYYVYKGNRRHEFSETLREHEKAREKYKDLWLSWTEQ